MPSKQNSSNRELWESRIATWKASGKSIRGWCLQYAISPSSFTYWKFKLFPKKLNKSAFVEILEEESTGIEVRYKGFEIHIGKEFDEQNLSRCLKVIRSFSC